MRDWKDLWAALAGCAMVFIAVFVGVLFFIVINNLK